MKISPTLQDLENPESLHLNVTITREEFEEASEVLLASCKSPIKDVLRYVKRGVGSIQYTLLVGGSTRMPMIEKFLTSFFGKKPNSSANPDEIVAIGAAVQAGIITSSIEGVVLLDVTPLSLGMETDGYVNTILIPRNRRTPCTESSTFSTSTDYQTKVKINVLQGERPFARDNKSVGNFVLEGLQPAARGVAQIDVQFDMNMDGLLSVAATERATQTRKEITITRSSALSDAEIEKIQQEAEVNAEEDGRELSKVELRIALEDSEDKYEKHMGNSMEALRSEKDDFVSNLKVAHQAFIEEDYPCGLELTETLSQYLRPYAPDQNVNDESTS